MRRKLDGAINFTASHNPAPISRVEIFSADAGPPAEVTKDIEARAAQLAAKGVFRPSAWARIRPAVKKSSARELFEAPGRARAVRPPAQAKPLFIVDALHGCGAGYLDRTLADHGVTVQAMARTAIASSDGTGPDVSEENLAPLRKSLVDSKATAGLATDGDADASALSTATAHDSAQLNPCARHDYLVETRNWKIARRA